MKYDSSLHAFSQAQRVDSNESEGAFNDFIDEKLKDMVEDILSDGDLDGRSSEIIIEVDDIRPPTFTYGDNSGEGQGRGKDGPGEGSEKIRFTLPLDKLMEMISHKLGLPNLVKEGQGKIKEVSYEFKTFGTAGVILDRKRTFKRALRTAIGTGTYKPDEKCFDILIRRRDRRYKLPERIEKPKYRAVVFYMGDISYSTYGERLKLEKRVVSFIHHWLNYNYGINNVDHRFFVHDSTAYEVQEDDFFNVQNAGGTQAAPVFDLVGNIAFNEYDMESTNFYAFYFGDGELFSNDANDIVSLLDNQIFSSFNRIGVVEIKPGSISNLVDRLREQFTDNPRIRMDKLDNKQSIVRTLKYLFGA